jgi:hypothetical protein
MKHTIFWDVTACGTVRTDVSEDRSASIIKVTRIAELGTTLAITSNRRMLRINNNDLKKEELEWDKWDPSRFLSI